MDAATRLHILQRAAQGASLRQLRAETGLPKSTVYYHSRGTLQRRNSQVMLKQLTQWEQGYLTGLFASDGHLDHQRTRYSYRVVFSLHEREQDIRQQLSAILRKAGGNPIVLHSRTKQMVRVICISKALYRFLASTVVYREKMHGGVRVNAKDGLSNAVCVNTDFTLGFLSGYIDGDGHVGLDRGRPRAVISTSSQNMAADVFSLCQRVGINTTIQQNRTDYIIRISTPAFIKWAPRLRCVKGRSIMERLQKEPLLGVP